MYVVEVGCIVKAFDSEEGGSVFSETISTQPASTRCHDTYNRIDITKD
jgi:hypothetical protein